MRYYPVNLNIRNQACLVVGGGGVGTRKVGRLLDCGSRVTVISPEITPGLQRMADTGSISVRLKAYATEDIAPFFLIIGATNQEELNRRISHDAKAAGKLCNIVDRPELCNFILPAIVTRGDLVISVSTSGQSPAFAKHLRKQMETQFGAEYAVFLELMGAVRQKLLQAEHAPEAHKPLFEALVRQDLLTHLRENNTAMVDHLLQTILGAEFTIRTLLPEYQQPFSE